METIEVRISELPQTLSTNSDETRDELMHVEAIRREVDENALNREQLNHIAAEICAAAPPVQV